MDEQDREGEVADVPSTPPPYERGNTPQTPLTKPSMESPVLSAHDRLSIHAYLRDDLKIAQGVSLGVFIEVIFGLTPPYLDEWVSTIGKQEWYKDSVIANGLETFCKATKEVQRYRPLVAIVNRVMDMAHGKLPDVPDIYPIDDICVVRNDPTTMQTIKEHGDLGALRKPDLLTLRSVHADGLKPQGGKSPAGVKWVQDIINWEIKGNRELSGMYLAFLEDRRKDNEEENDAHLPCRAGPSAVPPAKSAKASTRRRRPARRTRKRVQPAVADSVIPESTAGAEPTAVDATVAGCAVAVSTAEVMSTTVDPFVADSPVPVSTDAVRAGIKRRAERSLVDAMRQSDPPNQGYIDRLNSSEAASFAAKDASVQVGSYALETLACTYGTRLFCVNIAIENDRLFFWYYDACGCICTVEGISLVADFEKAAAILVGLACCTPERLGALPTIFKPPTSTPYPKNWPPENLSNHTLTLRRPDRKSTIKVTFEDPIFTQYALLGRRTFVYKIKTSPALSKKKLIVKISYQVSTRKKEQDLVEEAQKAGVGHMPEIHLSDDLWEMSDGIRSVFFEKAGIQYEDRTLRAIVYSRYLPLQALVPQSPECLPMMAEQIINCLYDLKEKANILHRDVSVHNIMHEYRNGELYFVLIDFDMATVVSTGNHEPYVPSSQHRTGTLPFMAIELIDNAAKFDSKEYVAIAHWVRHDAESVFWVAIWCIMVLVGPENDGERQHKRDNIDLARRWETHDLRSIVNEKKRIRGEPLDSSGVRLLARAECLRGWLDSWYLFWSNVNNAEDGHWKAIVQARRNGDKLPSFHNETIGGSFTRKRLMETGVFSYTPQAQKASVQASTQSNDKADTSERPASDATPAAKAVRKGKKKTSAVTDKPVSLPKTRATRKASTARKIAAAAKPKPKPAPRKAATRRGKAKSDAQPAEQRNGDAAEDDIRKRLRPRKRVNYKI